jgi:hypothetical protein
MALLHKVKNNPMRASSEKCILSVYRIILSTVVEDFQNEKYVFLETGLFFVPRSSLDSTNIHLLKFQKSNWMDNSIM